MSWGVIFRIRQYLKGSLWFYPLIGAILGPLVALIVHQADASVTLPRWLAVHPLNGEHAITDGPRR